MKFMKEPLSKNIFKRMGTVYWLVQNFEIFVIEQTHVQFLLGIDRTCNLISRVDLIGGPALYMVPHLTCKETLILSPFEVDSLYKV